MYNYYDEVLYSLVDFIEEDDWWKAEIEDGASLDRVRDKIYEQAWLNDGVTGNGSGSYYCNSYKAEEALAHNWDLLREVFNEFGCESNPFERGPEACDVTIRCYLLNQVLDEAMEKAGVVEYFNEYGES